MTQDRIDAKITALENAAEFIRNHGEEGGIDDDTLDFGTDLYLQEAKKVADFLFRKANAVKVKYGLITKKQKP